MPEVRPRRRIYVRNVGDSGVRGRLGTVQYQFCAEVTDGLYIRNFGEERVSSVIQAHVLILVSSRARCQRARCCGERQIDANATVLPKLILVVAVVGAEQCIWVGDKARALIFHVSTVAEPVG